MFAQKRGLFEFKSHNKGSFLLSLSRYKTNTANLCTQKSGQVSNSNGKGKVGKAINQILTNLPKLSNFLRMYQCG